MLDIKNLRAKVGDKEILRGIDLHVGAGEVHAIMGPNGSGKSTLAHVLSGREAYEVTAGTVTYQGKDLLAMAPEIRAREGIFLAFQYPDLFSQGGAQRRAQASWPGRTRRHGVSQLDQGQDESGGDESNPAQPAAQRGFFRRRKEAQRNLTNGGTRSDARAAR